MRTTGLFCPHGRHLRSAPLWGAFSLSASLELMLRVWARFARPEQPLCGIGNEQVPIGIDLPLNGYPALFLGHLDPKPGRRLDLLAQQGAGREFNEIVARTGRPAMLRLPEDTGVPQFCCDRSLRHPRLINRVSTAWRWLRKLFSNE